ncbi:MAG: hypothetical protein JXA53_05615 [Bacteroidales bacterium]|nr:hypothetical protein [Bacteroidales bacterium]
MIFQKQQKLADVIHKDYNLLRIINRFGIKLGFGDKSIAEVCLMNNINTDFFIEILNIFHDHSYFPKRNLKAFSMETIISYLSKTHSHYIDTILPEIESMIKLVVDCKATDKPAYSMIFKFFNDYRMEMREHVRREEEIVFPFSFLIEESFVNGSVSENLRAKLNEFSISDYYRDHEDIEEKLFDLKNIIIKYLPEPDDNKVWHNILNELFLLEKDMNDHTRMEDLVMVPKIIEMEKKLREDL